MPRDTPVPMAQVKDSTTYFGAKSIREGGVSPGGLDLLTPPLSLHPGAVRDILNFQVELNGGYGRIAGYEIMINTTSIANAEATRPSADQSPGFTGHSMSVCGSNPGSCEHTATASSRNCRAPFRRATVSLYAVTA